MVKHPNYYYPLTPKITNNNKYYSNKIKQTKKRKKYKQNKMKGKMYLPKGLIFFDSKAVEGEHFDAIMFSQPLVTITPPANHS